MYSTKKNPNIASNDGFTDLRPLDFAKTTTKHDSYVSLRARVSAEVTFIFWSLLTAIRPESRDGN